MAGEGKQMPRFNLQRDSPQLSKAQLDYMKLVELQVSLVTSTPIIQTLFYSLLNM